MKITARYTPQGYQIKVGDEWIIAEEQQTLKAYAWGWNKNITDKAGEYTFEYPGTVEVVEVREPYLKVKMMGGSVERSLTIRRVRLIPAQPDAKPEPQESQVDPYTANLFTKREIEIAYLIGLMNAKHESGKYIDELSNRLEGARERIEQMIEYIKNLRPKE